MTPAARFPPSLALWTFAGMGAALVLGIAGKSADLLAVKAVGEAVAPLGSAWINALQMTVIPLVITQLLAALVRQGDAFPLGRLGGRALGLFAGLNLVAGLFGVALASLLMGLVRLPPDVTSIFQAVGVPHFAMEAAQSPPASVGDWIVGLFPRNPFEAAAQGNLLQLLIFTILVGTAAARLPQETRLPLAQIFASLADAMLVLVSWVLLGAPLGVFALILNLTLQAGVGTFAVVGGYLLLVCIVLAVTIGLLYPLAILGGRVSFRSFARALAPAQIVAASTLSSLATLPALIQGGKEHLDLPEESTGFVLPLSASTFKLSTVINQTVACLFLARVFGVPLGVGDTAAFMLTMILLSFTTVGIPGGGGAFRYLPFFLAVGVPVEGVVIVAAAKTIPDVFMTVLNSTAYMTVAVLLSRQYRSRRGVRPSITQPAQGFPNPTEAS
ncbi:MAG: dicarboxylate/amino acid:cation symporter [Gemmatimonadota bacterium]